MGHKSICISCRKAFNHGSGYENVRLSKCPECGQKVTLMSHRFRPPKKTDLKKWKVVKFLIQHGFFYQHIYDEAIIATYVTYPETMKAAKEFVVKYKIRALNQEQIDKLTGITK